MFENIAIADQIVVLLYIVLLLGIGLLFSRKENNSTDYFLAEKKRKCGSIGASLFVTSIANVCLLGFIAYLATRYLNIWHFGVMAAGLILLQGWFFAPRYVYSGIVTLPEFLEQRYNRSSRLVFSFITLFGYLFIRIVLALYVGGLLLNATIGLDRSVSAFILISIAGIYAVTGGLKAILHVDILHAFVLLFAAIILMGFGWQHSTGPEGLPLIESVTVFNNLATPPEGGFDWYGIALGLPILGLWFWGTDHYSMQRCLAGGTIYTVHRAGALAALLLIVPVVILGVMNIVSPALFQGTLPSPVALGRLYPAGVKGVLVAGLLAVFISSLASSLNSSAALFTMDIYRHFHPHSTETERVLIGRLSTVAIVVLGIFLVPFLQYMSLTVFIYALKFLVYTSPAIVTVFLFGLFGKHVNGTVAIWTLLSGVGVSMLILMVELLYTAGSVHPLGLSPPAPFNALDIIILLFILFGGTLFVAGLVSDPQAQKRVLS